MVVRTFVGGRQTSTTYQQQNTHTHTLHFIEHVAFLGVPIVLLCTRNSFGLTTSIPAAENISTLSRSTIVHVDADNDYRGGPGGHGPFVLGSGQLLRPPPRPHCQDLP